MEIRLIIISVLLDKTPEERKQELEELVNNSIFY